MSETQADTNYPIYLGVWTNWSLGGRVKGSTLTLSHRNGALLTAFLAVFITFAGSRLWRIICFASHQMLQSSTPQDALYHQRQAVLRNSNDEKTGFLSLCYILLAWRQRARRPFTRLLPIIGLSLLLSIALMLGSIFSSRISSSMGNEVLISSPNCGIPVHNSSVHPTSEQDLTIYDPWVAERFTSFANYAQRCYSDSSEADSAGSSCTPFVKRRLPSIIDRNASCPFEGDICRNKYGNLKIDTGHFGSQDLGLNLPMELQFQIRKVLECAPLKSRKYQNTTYYTQDKPYVQYFYGPRTISPYTYEVEQKPSEEIAWRRVNYPDADYSIDAQACYIINGTYDKEHSSFAPIKELAQTNADVTLVFLSNDGIRYTKPVQDEWYAAHQEANDTLTTHEFSGHAHYYLSDEPASALGCKEQYQICDPTVPSKQGNGCSSVDGNDLIGFRNRTPRTKRELSLNWGIVISSIRDVITKLGSSCLTARFGLQQSVQGSLPANQWQREVENWHHILMAFFQGMAVEKATGPGNDEMLNLFWTRAGNDVEKQLCKSQKIISTAYTNFSTMWLTIVLVLGSLIILIEQSLEKIVILLERRNLASGTEWFGNDTLQLQRMAHEELGLGDWENCRGKAVPITQKGQLLGIFSTADPEHPKLINPNTVAQKPEGAAAGIDESGNAGRTSRASGTEVDQTPPSISQDGSHYSIHQSDSVMLAEHQETGQAESAADNPLGGQMTATPRNSSEQRLASPTESSPVGPLNASDTRLDASTVSHSASANPILSSIETDRQRA